MPRSVPEWIATHDDQSVPPRVRLRIWERYEGKCQCSEYCGWEIAAKPWQCDHKVALINGGEHRESNLQPVLVEHHKRKTKDDVAIKSYHYRRKLAHAGIKTKRSRPIFGSRSTPWKITFGRGVIRR